MECSHTSNQRENTSMNVPDTDVDIHQLWEEVAAGRAHYIAVSTTSHSKNINIFRAITECRKLDIALLLDGGFAGTGCSIYWVPKAIHVTYSVSSRGTDVDGTLHLGFDAYRNDLIEACKKTRQPTGAHNEHQDTAEE